MKKIDKKIVAYEVARDEPDPAEEPARPVADNIVEMHEKLVRPEALEGSTYKISTPMCDHALYVTINDIVLNPGTGHEQRRPFEIFINSKAMEHFQWIVALTRIMSAVFRKGGDCTFLVEELKAVFDPRGGYYKAGGVFMPSLVAEIGAVVETHMKKIGLLASEEMSEHQRAILEQKRKEYEAREAGNGGEDKGGFPAGATLCGKCNTKAVIVMDGCETCLNCGHSKCG